MQINVEAKRRNRMCRKATGKRVELSVRDIEIFKVLNRYRYLRSTFLHAFVGGSQKTRFQERLGDLYHETRHLNRPRQQWQFANARYMPVIYENGERAEDVLRQHGLLDGNTTTWLSRGRLGAHRQFAHAVMICDILASVELGVRSDPNLRFISWQEIIGKAPATTRELDNPFRMPVSISYLFPGRRPANAHFHLTPDGLFGLEYRQGGQKSYRFFALEADRNSMPIFRNDLRQSSWLKKLLAYKEVIDKGIYRSHLGLPNLFVLTVTTRARHMGNIMSLLNHLGSGRLFLFKTVSSLGDLQKAPEPDAHILAAPWARAGVDMIDISKP